MNPSDRGPVPTPTPADTVDPFGSSRFFDNVSSGNESSLESNSILLEGIPSAPATAAGGAHLIVDGIDEGFSAFVKAGSTVRLKAENATSAGTYTLTIGKFSAAWTVVKRAPTAVPGISGSASGYTPVEANVGASGAASVTLPITVSPGPGGLEPKLALEYSSDGGNGLLGRGFGLSGLSAVSRVGSKRYLDGVKSGVSFGPNDRFALDGQRLVLASGAEGTEGAEYRTEIESFSKVTCHGVTSAGPQSWTVKTKSGLTYEFGGTVDSRAMANRSSVSGDTAVIAWAVSRITDNVGNTLDFTYAAPETDESGNPRVSSIRYGVGEANAEIAFLYENRPDARVSYVGGAEIRMRKRLAAIESRQDGEVVRRYDLAYRQGAVSAVSQLVQVTESSDLALPPTQFTWDHQPAADMSLLTGAEVPAFGKMGFSKSPPSLIVEGDFNGDGRMDLMHFDDHAGNEWLAFGTRDGTFDFIASAGGFTAADVNQSSRNTTLSRIRTGDFNGDGKTDVLHMGTTGANNWVALSLGDGNFHVLHGDQLGDLKAIAHDGGFRTEILTMDIDGDGRTDLVYLDAYGNNRVFLAKNGNGSFTEIPLAATAAFRAFRISNNDATNTYVVPGDFNGDGLGDILLFYAPGSHTLALSNGDGTFSVRDNSQLGGIAGVGFRRTKALFVSGDFNGDGLTDVAHFDNDLPAWVALSKGDGTFAPLVEPETVQKLAHLPLNAPKYSRLLSADFDGDGLTDVYHAYFDGAASWLISSEGDTTFAVQNVGQLGVLDGRQYEVDDRTRLFTGDFDGDGADDVVNLHYGTDGDFVVRANGFDANRLVQVTTGHGGYTRFAYKPLTDPAVYTKGGGAVYPNYDVTGAMYVVSSVSTRNGVDGSALAPQPDAPPGESTTTYTYEGAQSFLDGHGFSGFAAVRSVDQTTGIVSRLESITSDPALVGRPVHETRQLADGTLIAETNTSWMANPITLPSGKHSRFPYATTTISKEYEINDPGAIPVKTTTVGDVVFDGFGNLTDSKTDYGGGFKEVTHSAYRNDTGHWWLGRLSETTVTQTSPAGSVSRQSAFEYSPVNGQLTKETIVTPESNLRLEKTYQHDLFGNIIQSSLRDVHTGDTRTTVTVYTRDGRFVAETRNSLGQVETRTYDPRNGTLLTQTGPNDLTTTWVYDGFGRPVRELRADGTETVTQYLRCVPGAGVPAQAVHCVRTQASGGPASTTYFDILDRPIQTDTAGFDGRIVSARTVYDARGQTTEISQPFFSGSPPLSTANEFDTIGRLIRQTAPGGRVTTTDFAGLVATVTNPEKQTFRTARDLRGRTASSTSFGHDTVTNTYDPYGNLVKVDDGHGHATTILYDGRGQKISMTEPNGGTTTYAYDAFGETTAQTDALKRLTHFFYDSLGRLVRRIDPEPSGPVETIRTYDTAPHGIGKLARVDRADDDYHENYRYDALGRATETLTRLGRLEFVSGTTFDEFGRPSVVSYPAGFAVRHAYNVRGYLTEVQDAADPGKKYWQAIAINARGQVEETRLGNGLTTIRRYDADTGLIQAIRTGGAASGSSSAVQNLGYSFDLIGNLIRRTDVNRNIVESFAYDSTNQLAGVTGTGQNPVTIACDPLGNISRRSDVGTYIYGKNGAGPHAVTRILDAKGRVLRDLRYDKVGNCVQDGGLTLQYNSINQPTRVANATESICFAYTPEHALLRRTDGAPDGTRSHVYIGGLYERENGPRGIVVHTHYITAASGVIAIHTATEKPGVPDAARIRYVHEDHLGSVQSLTREDGSLDEILDFDAWGRRRSFDAGPRRFVSDGVKSQTAKGFTGHEMLDAVGLIHMNGRIYDPTIGRFLSVDPVVQEAGSLQNLNRYAYVLNNPLSLTDPSGFVSTASVGYLSHASFNQLYGSRPFSISLSSDFNAKMWRGVDDVTKLAGPAATFAFSAPTFGQAFTGTLPSGGSIGDARRASSPSGNDNVGTFRFGLSPSANDDFGQFFSADVGGGKFNSATTSKAFDYLFGGINFSTGQGILLSVSATLGQINDGHEAISRIDELVGGTEMVASLESKMRLLPVAGFVWQMISEPPNASDQAFLAGTNTRYDAARVKFLNNFAGAARVTTKDFVDMTKFVEILGTAIALGVRHDPDGLGDFALQNRMDSINERYDFTNAAIDRTFTGVNIYNATRGLLDSMSHSSAYSHPYPVPTLMP